MTRADEAKRFSILLEFHMPVGEDVVAWADSQIAASDAPCKPLLDLSTKSPQRTPEMLSHLHALAAGADSWSALRVAVPRLREHLLSHPEGAEGIAHGLFHMAVSASDVPPDFKFACRFDDAFHLARERVFGNVESVRREFLDELARFTPRPNQAMERTAGSFGS
jgi:hypothetical protein